MSFAFLPSFLDSIKLFPICERYYLFAGDIIYTYEFEKFRQECKMNIYMYRGADSESKGKIESTVKYIKGNFLVNRIFIDDATLNESCLKWLARTGNTKVHGTTKRIPAEVFKDERETLRPIYTGIQMPEANIRRNVRKDNTIIYDSNRYSVPFRTYNNFKEVIISLAVKGLDLGYVIAFETLDDLMNILKTSEISGASKRRLKYLKKAALIIVDEVGFMPLSLPQKQICFSHMTGNSYRLEHHQSITG